MKCSLPMALAKGTRKLVLSIGLIVGAVITARNWITLNTELKDFASSLRSQAFEKNELLNNSLASSPWTPTRQSETQSNATTNTSAANSTLLTKPSNHSSAHQPTIFVCKDDGNAIGEFKSLLLDVLPEYRIIDFKSIGQRRRDMTADGLYLNATVTHENDIFIEHVGGRCTELVDRWRQHHFRGKRVFTSGEDRGPPRQFRDDMYFLGPRNPPPPPSPKSDRMLRLYYLQLVYWLYIRHNGKIDGEVSNSSSLFDATRKPRGTKQHFLIYGQANCVGFREEALDELSLIAPAHVGGKCKGKTPVGPNKTIVSTGVRLGNWWDNTKVYKNYRFCLVMEHAQSDGYVTEKILMAYVGGCIPIYYGTTEIFDLFNKESFVFYNISDPQPALDQVAYLERNRTAYENMMNQPILANGDKTIQDYFSFSDDVGNGKLKAKIRQILGVDPHSGPGLAEQI